MITLNENTVLVAHFVLKFEKFIVADVVPDGRFIRIVVLFTDEKSTATVAAAPTPAMVVVGSDDTDRHVLSPAKTVYADGVPVPNLATFTVPLDIFDAFNVVKLAPDTAPNEPDHVPVVAVPVVTIDAEPAAGAYEDDAVNAADPKVPPVPIFKFDASVPDNVSVLVTVSVFDATPPVTVNPATEAANDNSLYVFPVNPAGILALSIVPELIFDAFKAVKFVPAPFGNR